MVSKIKQKKRTGFLYRRFKGKDLAINDPIAKNGTIWLQYRLHGKMTRLSLKTSDIKEAEAKRATIMNPLRSADEAEATAQLVLKATQAQQKYNTAIRSQNPPLSIADAWDAYVASHERPDSGDATLRNYSFQWKRFKIWYEEKYPNAPLMEDVTPQIAAEYASNLTTSKLTPNTYNKHTNLLKLVFETLKEPARIEINPFEKIKRKKLKTESKRELTPLELKTILLSTDDQDLKRLLYLGTFTGLRLGDCATLKWGEIDMDKLLVRRVPNKLRSRSSKPVTVGIPAPLYVILNETPKSKRRGFVLPSVAKNYQKEASGVSRWIQIYFENCGIQTHKEGTGFKKIPDPSGKHEYLRVHTGKRAVVEVGFHSLRHTFVSLHAAYGTPQAVIMAIVGHGNPAMTAHYTHIGEETARQAAGALITAIPDAEYELIKEDAIPDWIIEKLKTQTAKNWKKVRDELVGAK